MRTLVINLIVDKLMEVLLDIHNVAPEIFLKGATIVKRDIHSLVGSYFYLPAVHELLEITKFMTMDYDAFRKIFAALEGLTGSEAFIDLDELSADTKLKECATRMLKAKGVDCPLQYAVSILNRRRS